MIGEKILNFHFWTHRASIRAMQAKQRRKRGRKGSRSHKPRYRTTWIRERGVEDRAKTSNVSKFERVVHTVYIPTDGRRPLAPSRTLRSKVRGFSRSRHLCRTRSYRGEAHDARWVPLRSSSTGVPRRPQGSQGEGTSHAPAMSEKSTPLRRGVHTLTRPISIRA